MPSHIIFWPLEKSFAAKLHLESIWKSSIKIILYNIQTLNLHLINLADGYNLFSSRLNMSSGVLRTTHAQSDPRLCYSLFGKLHM